LVKIEETGGLKMIERYGAIKEAYKNMTDEEISIIQAKRLTEKEDKIICENVARDKAEKVQKELAEKGIKVEIK
jgi:ribosomal protein L7/L12